MHMGANKREWKVEYKFVRSADLDFLESQVYQAANAWDKEWNQCISAKNCNSLNVYLS